LEAGHIVHNQSRSNSNSNSHSRSSSTDKYANLAEKLERIEQQIQREKMSIDTHHNNSQSNHLQSVMSPTSICTFGEAEEWKSTSHQQESC